MFILEVAQSPDLPRAASKLGISLNAARLWLRTFKRAGVQGLAHPVGARPSNFPELKGEELALLSQWSEAGRGFSRGAAVILALSQGESVDAVAACQGITKSRVFFWRNRFLLHGFDAIAPKHRMAFAPGERDAIQKLQSVGSPAVAKRASVLLDLCDSGDVFATAQRHNVSLTATRNWIKAFRDRGVAGLWNPKLPPPTRPRFRAEPLVLPIQLSVDLQVHTPAGILMASGVTTSFSSRYVTVSLGGKTTELVGSKDGCRVSAKVHWPAPTPDGRQPRLRLSGTVVQTAAQEMRIEIRTFAFIPAK
jgi:transposase